MENQNHIQIRAFMVLTGGLLIALAAINSAFAWEQDIYPNQLSCVQDKNSSHATLYLFDTHGKYQNANWTLPTLKETDSGTCSSFTKNIAAFAIKKGPIEKIRITDKVIEEEKNPSGLAAFENDIETDTDQRDRDLEGKMDSTFSEFSLDHDFVSTDPAHDPSVNVDKQKELSAYQTYEQARSDYTRITGVAKADQPDTENMMRDIPR